MDVGSGLGYSSAVISLIAQVVIAVEDDSSLASEAAEILSEIGIDNVVVQVAKLEEGAPEHGPYDVIILQGGVEEIPMAIIEQLKDGGRIVALFADGIVGRVMLGIKKGKNINWRFEFNAMAPILNGFEKEKEFNF